MPGVMDGPGADFDAFVERDAARLAAFAAALTGDRAGAEDLVQTALIRTAIHWRAATRNPEGYARATLVNLARDGWRARLRRPRERPLDFTAAGAEAVPQAVAGGQEHVLVRQVLLQACRTLPLRQRAVLVLRFWEDRSVEETAAVLGCGTGTVKSHTSRALAALRAALTESGVHADLRSVANPAHRE